MNIEDIYANATEKQKIELKKAKSDWEREIELRGDPPYEKGLDSFRTDYYEDITEKYKERIRHILGLETVV